MCNEGDQDAGMYEVIDALREIGNIGSGNAAASLEDWLGEPVTISLTDAVLVPAEEISHHLGGTVGPVLGIHARVMGGLEGHIVFLASVEEVRKILEILVGGTEEDAALSECEISALSETGNILFSSYFTALYEMLDTKIDITPPECSHDLGSFMGGALVTGYRAGKQYMMLIETRLISGAALHGCKILFLTWVERVSGIIELAENR